MVLNNPLAPDVWFLLAMLLVILLNPVLDHGDLRRLLLTGLTFVPVVLATIRLAQTKRYVRPAVLLMSVTFFFGVICIFFPNPVLLAIKWGSLAAFFALTYLANAPAIARPHLYTAISVYLLLGMMWFALYAAIDAVSPGAFQHGNNTTADRQSELLYFSLVTLATVGYGDIIPFSAPGFTEVSAVCTHPDHLGHGYATGLMVEIMQRILGRGETPFLHVRGQNRRAIDLYRRLGYVDRHIFQLAILRGNAC